MVLKNFFIFSIVILYLCPNCQSTFSWPDLSATSGKFDTYTIDFRVLDSARGTYWSLCNWYMNDEELKSKYSDITGGGAYGGLQILSNGTRVAIISFWDTYYMDNGVKKTVHLNRVYPGKDQIFTGSEGEGTTLRDFYNWKDGTWYRYVLHCWEDNTGHTFIGNWIQDLSTQQWTLFAYFDCGSKNSFILAGGKRLHMFQELFDSKYWYYERSFQIRNMYTFDREKNKWISINSTYLEFEPTTVAGRKELGFTNNYFYGLSGPAPQGYVYDPSKNKIKGTIKQPEKPEFNKPVITKLEVSRFQNKNIIINWEIDPKSCPCYQYIIRTEVLSGSAYRTFNYKIITRPETTQYVFNASSSEKNDFRITLMATGISHIVVSKEIKKNM